jgi:hypothetical protein
MIMLIDIDTDSLLESGFSENNESSFGSGDSSRYAHVRQAQPISIPVSETDLVVKANICCY